LQLNVVDLNAAAENLLGVSRRQSVSRSIRDFFIPSEELVTLCQRAVDTELTYGVREIAVGIGERETLLDFRAAPLEGSGALLLELFDAERDRQIRREAELVAQRRVSRRIISQLAHEVKNPLGGLRGAAQLLARQLPDAAMQAYTNVIIEEADRLASLVDGILEAGGQSEIEVFNLHEVTEHVAQLIDAEKPGNVQLKRDYDPSLPLTTADRGQIIQAFLNLAKNGLQAIGSKGTLTFRTRALSNYTLGGEQHRLVLSAEVEDTGPGIPEELWETIFYPLVTGRPTGSGLGLTIAQDLVSRNGGLIEFRSRPGETVFQVMLPVTSLSGSSF
jgi:two-component system nitrogen regulation sensor histidine kinase GlnL